MPAGLGDRESRGNINALVSWERAEGGNWNNSAHYNPLNTTLGEPGATSMNSVGVKSYTSWAQGFKATIDTLRNGRYGSILSALASGAGSNFGSIVASTPWGTGAFNVYYVAVAPSAHEAAVMQALVARAT